MYEKYFGGTHRDYFAIAFAAVAAYYLPYGAKFDGRVDYLPAVDAFVDDYLLRSEAALTMPLIEPISAKFSVVDEYDNTPPRTPCRTACSSTSAVGRMVR